MSWDNVKKHCEVALACDGVTPKQLRRKPKREGYFTCRDGKRYARQQASTLDTR